MYTNIKSKTFLGNKTAQFYSEFYIVEAAA